MKKVIQTDKAPPAIGPYTQAVLSGDFIFISGQIPIDPASQELVVGNIELQTETVLNHIRSIVEEAGLNLDKVVKTTVYLTDLKEFPEMNSVYSRFFKESPPARATVQVSSLPKGAKIEIEAIASVK